MPSPPRWRRTPTISHVGLVHSETGSGIIHDPAAIGAVVRRLGRRLIVDAVSAFGALPLDLSAQPEIDAVVFTSNKCLEGVPGMAFAVARIDRVRPAPAMPAAGRSTCPVIYAHALRSGWGSFRFTPPAQVLNAFNVALDLYDAEGGQPARLARYTANMRTLYDGVRGLGLTPYLPPHVQGPIIVNVHAPADPAWDLQRFVDALKARGVLISNFYNTDQPSFRVGCIGAITPYDMARAVAAMGEALGELGIEHRKAAYDGHPHAGIGGDRDRCRKARARHTSTWCRWTSPPSTRRNSIASTTPSMCRRS